MFKIGLSMNFQESILQAKVIPVYINKDRGLKIAVKFSDVINICR